MTGLHTRQQVTEQDLHLKLGAYDEIHHPHGYVHTREKHRWYWFAGLAGGAVVTLALTAVCWQIYTDRAPLCEQTVDSEQPSPDGGFVLTLAHVSCLGGAPEQKLYVRKAENAGEAGRNLGKPIASFDDDARIEVRWQSNDKVAIAKSGGRIWFFQPNWKNVQFQFN